MGIIVEKVPCCVCNQTGKIPRFVFWEQDCKVCKGTGERNIIMDADFPEHIKQQVRSDATYGFNRPIRLMGEFESIANAIGNRFF